VGLSMCLFVFGCTTSFGIAARDSTVTKASEAYDESLYNAEVWLCRGASVGSVIRRYGISPEQWDSWLKLCQYDTGALPRPIPPVSE
jgi:hypothetical protein